MWEPTLIGKHLLVDMTLLGPHGQNGGAGVVATSLVRHISELAPELQVTLLTSPQTHAELASLDSANVARRAMQSTHAARSVARRLTDLALPPCVRVPLKRALRSISTSQTRAQLVRGLKPDLLFCPFTAPTYWQPDVPCVSIVYDLQYLAYPRFFTPEQRLNRHRDVLDACVKSRTVVCISDYVRQTLVESFGVRARHAVAVLLGLLHPLETPDANTLVKLGLEAGQFLLYPANFWHHKNHKRLFEAMHLYRQKHPNSRLKLVCTGAPNALMSELESWSRSMFPVHTVIFAGYLNKEQLAALLQASAALIFPSLYEGFGMPVLEAMAIGKPVLCSNVTSLPEVAADAATYFDPTDVQQISEAIEALDDGERMSARVLKGRQRAAQLGDARAMAERYLQLFQSALAEPVGA